MGKKYWVELILLTAPTSITIIELKSRDPFSAVLVGAAWFAVLSIILVLYIRDRLNEIDLIKEDIRDIKKEINLNDKIIQIYKDFKK